MRGVWIAIAAAVASYLWLDAPISALATRWRPTGDLRNEMGFVQQFGAISSIILTVWLVSLLDRRGRIRLWDLLASVGLTALAALALKILVGRPRPFLGEPEILLGPFGQFPLPGVGIKYSWDPHVWGTAHLWSFPSSHTSAAFVLATFLALAYPRIRAFAWTMACLVGLIRVSLHAHYLSDVIGGAILGWWVAKKMVGGAVVSRAGRLA